jgi:adenosylmethionine-8-amino-7-oxononanoate aminotransferase
MMGLDGYLNGLTSVVPTVTLPSFESWLNDPSAGERLLRRQIKESSAQLAAVFVEVIQGSGGVQPMPEGYASCLAECTREYGILLVVDEITTGVYRAGGEFLGHSEYPALSPDIVLLGKGLTAGMTALSVASVSERVWERVLGNPLTERLAGTTHSGNPIACAAALATLAELGTADTQKQRKEGADRLAAVMPSLESLQAVDIVTGKGHLWGISLTHEARAMTERRCGGSFIDGITRLGLNEGVLIHPLAVGVIPILPALTITESEIVELHRRLSSLLDQLV